MPPVAKTSDGLTLPKGLWEHQQDALACISQFLQSPDSDKKAALLTLPTGTGKTGIIAVAAALYQGSGGHRLVLTPWAALVRQLIEDTRERFWERLPAKERPESLPEVRRLPPSTKLDKIASAPRPTVFVATLAAITEISRLAVRHGESFLDPFRDFDFLIVDEGHYEPAQRWSAAIRQLELPTVLLTATPYRNDQKYFHISEDFRYRYPHFMAEEQRFLRTPQFERTEGQTPQGFADELIGIVEEDRLGGAPDVRVIVRCAEHEGIRAVVAAIRRRGRTAVGIHEQFRGSDPNLVRTVPETDHDAQYWVHQNKLIEGIDDPRFQALAFYDPLRTDRAVIQQIGRVLRNPGRTKSQHALVVSRGHRDIEAVWAAYKSFDAQDSPESAATSPGLVGSILESQPGVFYFDGAYRTRAKLDSPNAWEGFRYLPRTLVYSLEVDHQVEPSIDDLVGETKEEWEERDRHVFQVQTPGEDAHTRVIPYVYAENSRWLRTSALVEPRFGYTFIRLTEGLLFYFDTRGTIPQVVHSLFRRVPSHDLQGLFPSAGASITSVSLLNTDISRQAARTRMVRAAAIDELAPDLSDWAFICSTAEGRATMSGTEHRRYVGFANARITDTISATASYHEDYSSYSEWLDQLKRELTGTPAPVRTFGRYAPSTAVPVNPSAEHVLLDIDVTRFAKEDGGTSLDVEDYAAQVESDEFLLQGREVQYPATLTWDGARSRYQLESPSLRAARFCEIDGDGLEIVEVINREQAFRIIPHGRTAVYSRGEFFVPVIPEVRKGRFHLLDVLTPVEALDQVSSEKGTSVVNGEWDEDSVFGIISSFSPASGHVTPTEMALHLKDLDMLVCTDMGREIADFIAVENDRAVFIHAKARRADDKSFCSASALHDVISQATKNLIYLHPAGSEKPETSYWTKPWSAAGVEGKTDRLRFGSYTPGATMWNRLREVVSNPGSEREVWVVVGNSLSKTELIAQRNRQAPSAPSLQAFALLQSAWSAVSQVGARLRVFCSP